MSDASCIKPPVTSQKPKKKRTVRPVRVALFSGILLASAAALLLLPERGILDLDQIQRTITYHHRQPEPIPVGGGRIAFGADVIAAADGSRFRLLDDSGTAEDTEAITAHPRLLAAEDRAVLVDIGGNRLWTASKDGEPAAWSANGAILDANLTAQCLAVISRTDNGTVLSCETADFSRTMNPELRLAHCAANADGSCIAAVAYEGKNGEFSASVLIWAEDNQPQTIPLDGRAVRELTFLDDQTLCSVGEGCLYLLTADGEVLAAYDYGDDTLTRYTVCDRGVAFVLHGSRGDSLVSIDRKGALLDSVPVESVTALSSCGKYLAYAAADSLTVCYRDLTVYRQLNDIKHISAVEARPDGTVMAIRNGTAELYFYD